MNRFAGAACIAALLLILAGCGSSRKAAPGDYASLINRSGKTGMRGSGPFAAGSDRHPGYNELPIEVGSQGAWAPAGGNHEPITVLPEGSHGSGIASDAGGLGIGIH